jgi:hypothetical protein
MTDAQLNDADLYRARDREIYWERIVRLVERGLTLRAAHIVVDAAMFGIGCVEGTVRVEQQKRIDRGEEL